jgi:hypothetical protein
VPDSSDDLLLLDPSALLGDAGFERLADVPHDQRRQFVVAQTFFDQLADRAKYTEVDKQLWGPLSEGLCRPRRPK